MSKMKEGPSQPATRSGRKPPLVSDAEKAGRDPEAGAQSCANLVTVAVNRLATAEPGNELVEAFLGATSEQTVGWSFGSDLALIEE